MPDFHIVPCSCHGQMIWVRAVSVPEDVNTQILDGAFQDARPIVGSEPMQGSAGGLNPPRSLIDPTSIGGALAARLTLAPITFPAVHCGVCGAIEVPQRQYRSAPLAPDPTYESGEVIGFSKGGGCGVPIVDAAEYRLSDLLGGDDLMFINTTVSTFSVRIEWPGYKMWNGQFRARSWGGTNEPITRSRLALQIAKRVMEFLEAMEDVETEDMAWKVGRGHIVAKDLMLVSLAQVSKGSWQPSLRLLA